VRERTLTVTLTNASADSEIVVRLRAPGAREARGTVLTHADPAAANTFATPEEVKPAALPVTLAGDRATVRLPKQAVASLQIRLG
jgi:alpha-L-arabinofuranosidase